MAIDKISRIVNPAGAATPVKPAESAAPDGQADAVQRSKPFARDLDAAFPAWTGDLPPELHEPLNKLSGET